MKKKHFLLVALFAYSLLKAQTNSANPNNLMSQDVTVLETFKKTIVSIKGTPYIHENFVPATIGDFPKTQLVKYNAYSDEMEVYVSDTKSQYLKKILDLEVVINQLDKITFQFKKYTDSKNTLKTGYFIVKDTLKKGVQLYEKTTVKLQDARESSSGYDNGKPATFKSPVVTFYFKQNPNTALKEIPSNKRKFMELFKNKNMKGYLKQEKIDLSNFEDLKKTLTFYFQ